MEPGMELRQGQTLSPRMLQSMEILQMGSQELLEYIQETAQENPVLDLESMAGSDSFELMRRKVEWLESTDVQNQAYYHQDKGEDTDPLANYGGVETGEENLYRYVLSQLQGLKVDPALMEAAEFIVESLNQSGWLDEDVPELAAALPCSEERMAAALELVQSLEPAGVGARGLSECLRLQLVRRGEEGAVLHIVEEHLDALAKNQYGLIARALDITQQEAREAGERIRALDPRPGTGFAARENLAYITPDVILVTFPDHFELLTNDYFFPTLRLSGYYQDLMKGSDDSEVREYLSGKLSQAKWVVRSIEQRRSTLISCARAISRRQEDFFRLGPGHLRPMTLADVAGDLGVHESTVSRAVRDKYLQCSMGVYPLSYFFSRSLGTEGEAASPDGAKALLKRLIAKEDKSRPLSDQKLSEHMAREGYELARRTVAKYRDELGIPGASGRKVYE